MFAIISHARTPDFTHDKRDFIMGNLFSQIVELFAAPPARMD